MFVGYIVDLHTEDAGHYSGDEDGIQELLRTVIVTDRAQ